MNIKTGFALTLILAFSSVITQAQYYYRDLVSTRQLHRDMKTLKENKIRKITIKSIEADGNLSEGFFCEKKISKDYRTTELFTRSDLTGPSMMTAYFDETHKIIRTTDSSRISLAGNRYTYNGSNQLTGIQSDVSSADDDFITSLKEEHLYYYNGKPNPDSMHLIKNTTDTTLILFQSDELLNVSIEKNTRSGNKFFYYYDSKNRLTDVVNANEYKPGLIAMYVFEYNATDQITQMTTTEEGAKNFFIWKYTYENGLRVAEKCFTMDRKLMGSIEYEYK